MLLLCFQMAAIEKFGILQVYALVDVSQGIMHSLDRYKSVIVKNVG